VHADVHRCAGTRPTGYAADRCRELVEFRVRVAGRDRSRREGKREWRGLLLPSSKVGVFKKGAGVTSNHSVKLACLFSGPFALAAQRFGEIEEAGHGDEGEGWEKRSFNGAKKVSRGLREMRVNSFYLYVFCYFVCYSRAYIVLNQGHKYNRAESPHHKAAR